MFYSNRFQIVFDSFNDDLIAKTRVRNAVCEEKIVYLSVSESGIIAKQQNIYRSLGNLHFIEWCPLRLSSLGNAAVDSDCGFWLHGAVGNNEGPSGNGGGRLPVAALEPLGVFTV